MNTEIKAMLDSYLRNLLGVALALIATTMTSAGVSSPVEFGAAEWLVVANGLWAAAVPTLIRYLNKKDPAFGNVAEVASKEVSRKLSEAAKKAANKKTVEKKSTKK
jgi:type IV secretory pathway TrbD component